MKRWVTIIALILSSMAVAQEPQLIGSISSGNTNTLFGYEIVPIDDQNGDGYDDIMIFELRGSPEPSVFKWYFFYGGDTTTSIPFLTIDDVNARASCVGDLNGDFKSDLLIRKRFDKLGLYYGGAILDSTRDFWFGSDSNVAVGNGKRGYDININGTDEIFAQEYNQYSILLFELGSTIDTLPEIVLTPPNQTISDYSNMGNGLITGDFNGDGKIDLATNVTPKSSNTNGSIYLYWGGAEFDTIPNMIITRPGEYAPDQLYFGYILCSLGDFNGDGFDDFYAGTQPSMDTTGMIFFGGPSIDGIPDMFFPEKAAHVKLAGDINDDGYNDMITSYPLPFSTLGEVRIYFGGPTADSIADILYYNIEDPRYQTEFGQDCAGIGDFNGDGVDDFAYSFQTSGGIGEVYIYAGIKNPTDVDFDYEPNLPDAFQLHQNYPNPFNPSTTISFEIPNKSDVNISIYNVLGQKIRTLIDRELSAGLYTLKWDGKNELGYSVASGIYLYKLESDQISLSRKMMLLK